MKDLTMYGKHELSLQVYNDPYFYRERDYKEFLYTILRKEFIFTEEQMTVLIADLIEEEDFDA